MTRALRIREVVQDYYSEVLQHSDDLKTSACCPLEATPDFVKPLLAKVHVDVTSHFYGCGSPIPFHTEGLTVLDLGCGSGRDCYVLSQLVGPQGRVIGVDMTAKQLSIARKHLNWQTERFGYLAPNVEFRQGLIEDLGPLEDASVDLVVSNCVLNLSTDKQAVFREIFRVLKPGGELLFADVFADRRLTPAQQNHEVMLGECLGGALYVEDFRRILTQLDVADVRTVSRGLIQVTDPELRALAGSTRFYSITYRAFKLALEDRCEDYGQIATYRGGMQHTEASFILDNHHTFERDRPTPVCRNTAEMLSKTRYRSHFDVTPAVRHFGLFDCGLGEPPLDTADETGPPNSCC